MKRSFSTSPEDSTNVAMVFASCMLTTKNRIRGDSVIPTLEWFLAASLHGSYISRRRI